MIYLLFFPISVVIGTFVGGFLAEVFQVSNFEGGAGYFAIYLIMPVSVVIEFVVFYQILKRIDDSKIKILKYAFVLINLIILLVMLYGQSL
jgi:MFS family permease